MMKAAGAFSPLISVDRRSAQPLHRQVYDAFRAAILARVLRPGQRIPSTRSLASDLSVSRIPVLHAYAQLLAEGYFESRTGSGTFVSNSLSLPDARPRPAVRAARPARLGIGRRRIAQLARSLPAPSRSGWMRGHGAFSVSQPALDAFPLRAWSRLIARHCRNPLTRSLQYGDAMGFKPLRATIAAYLRTSRGVRCEANQVMIVSGSQQALDLSARVLLDSGSSVWMEEPGYWLARSVLRAAGCRLVPVPVDGEGLDVAAGIARCREARAAFVAPSHQYPLGVTMSAARRLQLLAWAQRAGSWIVEDDYDSEYRYESRPVASLQGLDHAACVIYIGTFSKVLFPSLRVGYVVAPAALVDRFLAMRQAMDVSPPHFPQAVLADFIAEGHFARHIRRMRALYGERRRVLVDSLAREFEGSLEVIGGQAGMYVTVALPRGRRDLAISLRAARQNLWLWPLSPAYMSKTPLHGFILGFGSVTAREIPAAVRQLRELMDKPEGSPRN
jgi:GntR family transcriptional regulator / MocR family aminotransferase